jgi:hypothetical protein
MHLASLPSLILAFSLGALADAAAPMVRDRRRRRKLRPQEDRG